MFIAASNIVCRCIHKDNRDDEECFEAEDEVIVDEDYIRRLPV